VVDVGGNITIAAGEILLRDAVDGLLSRGHRRISLDLHAVSYMDSAGLGELVDSVQRVRQSGGTVRVVNPSEKVDELLRVTHLATMLPLEDPA
jgi:anti-sigma B factor antagonist